LALLFFFFLIFPSHATFYNFERCLIGCNVCT
jgi:hypothetical protein